MIPNESYVSDTVKQVKAIGIGYAYFREMADAIVKRLNIYGVQAISKTVYKPTCYSGTKKIREIDYYEILEVSRLC